MNGNNSSSSTGHAPSGLNGTFNASTQQQQVQLQGGQPPFPLQQPQLVFNPPQPQPQPQPSYPPTYPSNAPALQNQNVPGPSLYALNEIAKETAGLAGKGLPSLPPTWNAGYAPPPPIPYNPQGPMYQWPGYGYHAPAPNYYGGHPGPQAHGAAPGAAPYPGAPMQSPPAPPAAHVPFHQQVQVMSHAAPMPQVPSVGPVEGSSTGSLKRKAADEDDMTEDTKEKRSRPQGNPDFERVPPGTDGKERWRCLKNACKSCHPMLEASVHKHITETVSHGGSNKYICEACGAGFNRRDALKRHKPSQQCIRNREKALAQANSQALGPITFASSSGPASSSATQQSLPPSVAPPHVVQVVGNSTSGAASSVAMSQQQFAFKVQGPASGSANQQSLPSHVAPPHAIQAAANRTFGATAPFAMSHQQFTLKARGPASSSHVPTWSAFSQKYPSLPENIQTSFKPTTVQQPAVAPPLQAFQGTPNQTSSTPLPSAPKSQPAQPSSGHTIPIVASDFSLSIFKPTAAPLQPPLPPLSLPPSEDVNDEDDEDDDSGLFSEPSSPTSSKDAFDPSMHLFSAPPSPSPD